jgi:hypothetical protein
VGSSPGAPTSPYVIDIPDNFDLHVTLTFTFNNSTQALTGASLTRDDGCQWNKIYVGLGGDGTPDTTPRTFDVSGLIGTRAVSTGQLAHIGLNTLADVLSFQVTAGP